MVPTLIAFVAPCAVAWFCLGALYDRTTHPSPADRVQRASLAFGLGIGLSSCLFFLWLSSGRRAVPHYWWLEAVCSVVLLAMSGLHRRSVAGPVGPAFVSETAQRPAIPEQSAHAVDPVRIRVLAVWVALLSVSLIAVFAATQWRFPQGINDALGIWNLHARVMLLDPDWREYFAEVRMWSHTDYPLLLPASVARLWLAGGAPTGLGPALIAFSFTAATVGVCAGTVARRRGSEAGLFCALGLLGTSFLIKHGANQYADVPLAFYIAAALALAAEALALEPRTSAIDRAPSVSVRGMNRRGPRSRTLTLSGLLAALAAWTKNEGLLFLASFVGVTLAVLLFQAWRTRNGRQLRVSLRSSVRPLLYGVLAVGWIIVYFKATIAPPNDLVAGQDTADSLARLLTLERYRIVLFVAVNEIGDTVKVMGPALTVFAICLGWRRDADRSLEDGLWLGTLGLVACGYLLVYIVTPHPLEWHVTSSVRRLFLQLWPAAVTALFLRFAVTDVRAAGSSRESAARERAPQ